MSDKGSVPSIRGFYSDEHGRRVSPVLTSAEFIASQSEHVRVSLTGVTEVAEKLHAIRKSSEAFDITLWKKEDLNPKDMNDDTLMWIAVVDTLNFCFWAPEGESKYTCAYKGKDFTGYWALCASVNRALDNGIPLLDASFLATITEEQLSKVFEAVPGTGEVPLLRLRLQCLRELGQVLMEKYSGHFKNVIAAAEGSAIALVERVMTDFRSYHDVCTYKGQKVYILKRAQILAADIWACFEGQGYGAFNDIDRITMFADYRVPQSMVALGLLQYSDTLVHRLKTSPHLEPGSEIECDIRGCSIWGVEMLLRQMKALADADENAKFAESNILNAVTLDFYLWTYAKREGASMDHIPIHKTWTNFY